MSAALVFSLVPPRAPDGCCTMHAKPTVAMTHTCSAVRSLLQRSLHATACKREPTVADEYTRSGDTPYRSSIEHLCASDSIWNFQKQSHQEKPHVVVQATTPDTEGRRRHPASTPHAKTTSSPLRLGDQCCEADCKSAPAATHTQHCLKIQNHKIQNITHLQLQVSPGHTFLHGSPPPSRSFLRRATAKLLSVVPR